MFPRFAPTTTHRPVALVAHGAPRVRHDPGEAGDPRGDRGGVLQHGLPAPYAAVELHLTGPTTSREPGVLQAGFTAGDLALEGRYDTARGTLSLVLTLGDREIEETSRRHRRPSGTPERFGVSLTGSRLAVHAFVGGAWTTCGVRAVDDLIDLHDPAVLESTQTIWSWSPRIQDAPPPVTAVEAGLFGLFGLRDPHLATYADGTPYLTEDGLLVLTATSAGPGFFDTAHCSTWTLDPRTDALTPRGHLFFRRPPSLAPEAEPRVYGDHATHLVRDGDRWLVASSTWGDFDHRTMRLTRAEVEGDPTHGVHVIDTDFWDVPTSTPTIQGVWDPHLVEAEGRWLLTFVEAERFFSFRPVIAAGESLDAVEIQGVADRRTATEGSVVVADQDGILRVLASDGRDNPRGFRAAYPVFDLGMNDIGTLEAPYYPTNIGWPMVARTPSGWVMITFDGDPHGGSLPGYGTHGDLRILHGVSD